MKTLKRMMVALLALLPFATGMACDDSDHGYSRLFVFGASFLDPGNHFAVTGEVAYRPFEFAGPSYAIGGFRFSNGRTWVEVLARDMNLAKWAKPAYRDPAFGNYAFGYARARNVEPDPAEPSLYDQVADWKANGYCTGAAMHDTLFVIDSAAFDAIDILEGRGDPMAILSDWALAIGANIGILYDCGARNFLIANLPPLETAPVLPKPVDPTAPNLSAIFNYVILQPVLAAQSGRPDINIKVVDFFAFFSGVMAIPKKFGFTNITDSCITFGVIKGAICKKRNRYFWWDPLHPTRKVHALMAREAHEVLTE
ncbi:MAG: SGNH/GDSL hydrolase family protein [Woeseiaceae bacterium]|nr:SGNH/GDSL hydrolase family protein [Woeseiaceae bacterium]